MANKELNIQLYEKMFSSQETFREWLLTQTPKFVLDHANEYSIREDILMALDSFDVDDLSDDQVKALLSSPDPLAEVYRDFLDVEDSRGEELSSCIMYRANRNLAEQQRQEALCAPSVYKKTAVYAREHNEIELYRASLEANMMCRDAIEEAISGNYKNNQLDATGAKAVLSQFGIERTSFVLAATVQVKSWDGRISGANKQWAKGFLEACGSTPFDPKCPPIFIINRSHPGLIDLFVNQTRREAERMKEQEASAPVKAFDSLIHDANQRVNSPGVQSPDATNKAPHQGR